MDVKIKKKSWLEKNKMKLLFMSGVFAVVILTMNYSLSDSTLKVERNNIWSGEVYNGGLQLKVQGFGKLQSKYTRLLTASVGGIVQEIVLKPGARVTKDSVILRLQNLDLDQQVANEQMQLSAEQANLRQARVNHTRELLSHEAQLTELEARFNTAAFNLQATSSLVASGVVSQLEHKRAELETDQLSRRLKIEKQRLEQLAHVHSETINIQLEKINQQQGKLNAVLAKQKQLVVTANIEGVLQKLPVELGQSVVAGEQLSFVGGTRELIAQINVSQSQVDSIQTGQQVDINTRGDIAKGIVTRIDPVVNAGTVMVEIDLLGDLPGNVRPELTVDATIHAGELSNVNYIERPVNVLPGSTSTLFRLNLDRDIVEAVQVTFGAEAGQHIQIISGAKQGDKFILSDTSRWQQHQSIILI